MPRPTFLIAGAPRAGTTLLYQLCADAPGVFMARPVAPEPKFFLVDEEYHKGLDWYVARYFADVGGARAWGEKSTNYLESPVAAARIARDLPEVRLVFLLRDPVERAFSNYLWTRRNGLETETFARALELEVEREAGYPDRWRYARPHSYRSRGLYATHLREYFERFPREQIHVAMLEDLRAGGERPLAALFTFLGVPPPAPRSQLPAAVNSARSGSDVLAPEVGGALRDFYRRPNAALEELLDRPLPAAWNGPRGGAT